MPSLSGGSSSPAGGGLGGPHQALYDQANSSLDTFFADFEKVEMAERGGLGGLPFLVQVCGSGSHDKYIAAGGEQLDVEVDTGSGVARCTLKMPDYARKSGGRGYVREGRDHAKYILARLPPALDPKRMPLTQRLLQAVRSGFGTQEQQELIAPSGYYNQNTNRFGWLPRRPFASFEGAPMANVPVSQDRWNMRGVVSAVAEVVGFVARVAGGFFGQTINLALGNLAHLSAEATATTSSGPRRRARRRRFDSSPPRPRPQHNRASMERMGERSRHGVRRRDRKERVSRSGISRLLHREH